MSYDKDFGFMCDECDTTIGGDPLTYMESKQEIDREGWLTQYMNGKWVNICTNCRNIGG